MTVRGAQDASARVVVEPAEPANARAVESLIAAALAFIGLGISTYLTVAHYQQLPLACSTTGIIDCSSVTHSSYSELLGVPVSVLGLIWFGLIGSCALVTASMAAASGWLQVQLGVAFAGLGFVLYLVYAELVQLHRICEWCTAVHLLTLGIFLLTIVRLQRSAE